MSRKWIMERDDKGTFRMKTVCGFLELNLFWEEEAGGWYNLYPIVDGKVLSGQATTHYWPFFDSDDFVDFFDSDDFVDVINEMERKLDEVRYHGDGRITYIEWDDDDIVFHLEETDDVVRITAQIYGYEKVFEFFRSENGITKATENGRELWFDVNELDA